MALLRDIVYKAAPKVTDYIKCESKKLTLKPLKRVTIAFDPFTENTTAIRDFSYLLYKKPIIFSNQKCSIKTEILCNRAEPTLTFELNDGKTIIFNCGNLHCLEIIKLMNEHITPLAPKEETVSPVAVKDIKKKRKK